MNRFPSSHGQIIAFDLLQLAERVEVLAYSGWSDLRWFTRALEIRLQTLARANPR